METRAFDSNSPGHLVPIVAEWGKDHAFVPRSLPPEWEFPIELWPLLSEAKKQVGLLEGLGRTLPNPSILLRPMSDREAIRSSRLEGTYASPKELILFELDHRESDSADGRQNDQREVFNYRKALIHGTETELPLSLRLLRELHQILLGGVRGKDRDPGQFRRIQVGIGSDGRFIPPPAEHVMPCLDLLEKYFHSASPRFDPLVDCFLVHYQFETIHPFIDGNGRVGRLLLAIMLQQRCEFSKPWLYMSEFFEPFRDEYIQNLFKVSTKGDWGSWIEFCLRGTLEQAKNTIARCQRLLSIREQFTSRLAVAGGSIRLSQIVDDIFQSPFVRITDLTERLGVTYPTAKADVDRLVAADILQELPNTYPKTYYAPEVFRVSYEKMEDTEN